MSFLLLDKKIYWIGLIISALLIVSCSSKPSLIVTDADNDKKIEIQEGTIFAVKLSGQLGTGYSWNYVSANKEFELIGKPEVITSGEQKTGGTDIQVFTFKAVAKGETDLKFIYIQPWEKDVKPKKVYNIHVIIN